MRTFKVVGGSLVALAMVACGGSAPPASAPAPEEAPSAESTPVAEPTEEAAENAGPHAVEVAVDAAQAVADSWDTEKAKVEEVTLTLRIRVDGKPASVKGSVDGAHLMNSWRELDLRI